MDLVRVDFALIPDHPLFESVVNASQTITDEYYYNENIIDDKNFPPHLSLHICTVPHEKLRQVIGSLGALVDSIGLPDINPSGIEPSSGGYVMLRVERTAELMTLHEAVLEIAATARDGCAADRYGSTYIRDSFTPHVSLAKLDSRDLSNAVRMGRTAFGEFHPARTQRLDLCDIGPRSEKWNVLARFPVTESQ